VGFRDEDFAGSRRGVDVSAAHFQHVGLELAKPAAGSVRRASGTL
jgi:hypothetical protein